MKFFICKKCGMISNADYTETKNKKMFCPKCNTETEHKLRDILVLKNDEKEVKKISLICDRCGQPFKYNVLFDKNGVSVNTIKTPLLCSNCICWRFKK